MTRQELELIFGQLAKEGWKPRLCSEFRYEEIGESSDSMMCCDSFEQYMMLPPELLSMHPTAAINVKDDSMIDADIKKGDVLIIRYIDCFEDGDVVMARINGKMCIRCYCEDCEGNIWLVPQNDKYDAVMIKDTDIIIFARVQQYIRTVPHLQYKSCRKAIDKVKNKYIMPKKVTEQHAKWVIVKIAPQIKVARLWFAVYRPLVQRMVVANKDYDYFCNLVKQVVPNHDKLPIGEEIRRRDDDCFRWDVEKWTPLSAPVKGATYYKYKRLADYTLELLDNDEED